MPIAINDQVYDNEVAYQIDRLPANIKKVYITGDDAERTPEDLGLSTEDKNTNKPEKIEQQIRNRQDPKVIYNDQGDIVDYDLPSLPTMPLQDLEKLPDSLKQPEGDMVPEKPPETKGNLLDQAKSQYPILNKYDYGYTENFRPNAGFLEHWQPGDKGIEPNGPNSLDSLRPSTLPLDKPGLEIRDPNTKPSDIMADIVSHHLINEDPFVKKTYEDLKGSMTPKQEGILKDQYEYAQKNEGETGTYEDWKQRAGMPAFLRGYAFKQWPDEFNDKAYTPEQKQSLDKMVNYLKDTPKEKGFFERLSIVNAVRGMMNPTTSEDPKIISGFIDTVKNAFSLPGDVYGGKIDPSSKQGIERSFDLATMAVFGPAPVAAKMADGTLGSFMGVKSKTFDRNALGGAQTFEKQGLHADEVYEKTGTFRGAEGRWRQEIDDSSAKFNKDWYKGEPVKLKESADPFEQIPFDSNVGMVAKPLPEVLDHPELYKAYPQLKDTHVVYDPKNPSAHFDPSTGDIFVGEQLRGEKSTLLHEVQHAIQDIEGFGKGGMPGEAGKHYELKFAEALRTEIYPEFDKLLEKSINKGLNPMEENRFQALSHIMYRGKAYEEAGNALATDYYMRLVGEVEARNTEARILLNKEERRAFAPSASQEFPNNQQILVDDAVETSPYGIKDPRTGEFMKVQAPTNFRRGANDNMKDFPLYGNVSDVEQLARKLAEAENGKGSWDRIGGGGQEHYWRDAEKALKKRRPSISTAMERLEQRNVKIADVNKRIDDLMKKYPHSEIDKARLKKLQQERLDIWK